MRNLFAYPSQVITVNTNGKNYKRGTEMSYIEALTDVSIITEDGIVKEFIKNSEVNSQKFDEVIDCTNKIILPGLVECHTHTVFAGNRSNEFRQKISGTSYEEIAKQGGGINATVQAVRNSSFEELLQISKPRIDYFIAQGITTLEIKSGYGLSYYDEIKLLQVIKRLNEIYPIDIIPTFLGAHTFPPEYKNDHSEYISVVINEIIPYIAQNNLAVFCDAFCEETAFSAKEVEKIFDEAKKHGLKLKLHTDQFNRIGGVETALKMNAVSVDHLEVADINIVERLSNSETTAVLLPGVSFFLNYGYAPARDLIDNNAVVALATDYNPGSSNIADLNLIMSLAAIKMKMKVEETISAVTINAANALSLSDKIGSIEPGKNADFSVFDTSDYSDLVYNVAKNLNVMTIKNGKLIFRRN
ncbi:MAG: imidazolonepropionase [Melioribacteraceae bacterium]|nr:imidazolonepropionase [Melioribacteraceae bacterium]MCO6472450.1 imidazolonepropionase [Melioribacteraceae bacterium]MDD3559431.1 imidazolonepropionase [Melioribacteraceae bacterium]